MNGGAYYNEIDDFAADWLENLICAGHIPAGDVDRRSIVDVRPDELRGYRQCHFFAGIAGWSLALALAGWPEDREVWTGSCPCQPFSAAGKRGGADDKRHLWPAFHDLIAECRPPVVFGEQVASADGRDWLAAVRSDLEALGYAFGAADLCAAGIGAPHIRQRLGFVADADNAGLEGRGGVSERPDQRAIGPGGMAGGMADADGRDAGAEGLQRGGQHRLRPQDGGAGGGMADAERDGFDDQQGVRGKQESARLGRHQSVDGGDARRPGPLHQPWRDADWLLCRDGKWRPVEPGTFPLLDGLPACLERLRAIENEAWQAVEDYGRSSNQNPDEVLRMVWAGIQSQEDWQGQPIGMRQQLHAAPVLFNFLLNLQTTRDGTAVSRRLAQASDEGCDRVLRCVRLPTEVGCSSREWRPDGQSNGEFADPLLSLSLLLARLAQAHRSEARKAHAAANRVGMLRAYGNAIVPPLWAEFIRAYIEARGSVAA